MFAKLFELRDKKLKENKKKGFTLVELIVVLVILAILAALLIPALTGYINKAKEKSIIAETRQVVMAAQTLADEQYGTLTLADTTDEVSIENGTKTGVTGSKITIATDEIKTLAEVEGTIDEVKGNAQGQITTVKYTTNGKTCTYDSTKKNSAKYSVN